MLFLIFWHFSWIACDFFASCCFLSLQYPRWTTRCSLPTTCTQCCFWSAIYLGFLKDLSKCLLYIIRSQYFYHVCFIPATEGSYKIFGIKCHTFNTELEEIPYPSVWQGPFIFRPQQTSARPCGAAEQIRIGRKLASDTRWADPARPPLWQWVGLIHTAPEKLASHCTAKPLFYLTT